MLSISRSPGQSFTIDKDITIRVVWIENNKVRLAIDAPGKQILRDNAVNREPVERVEHDIGGEG